MSVLRLHPRLTEMKLAFYNSLGDDSALSDFGRMAFVPYFFLFRGICHTTKLTDINIVGIIYLLNFL